MIEFAVFVVAFIGCMVASGNSVRLGVEAAEPENNTPEAESEANWSLVACLVFGVVAIVLVLGGGLP